MGEGTEEKFDRLGKITHKCSSCAMMEAWDRVRASLKIVCCTVLYTYCHLLAHTLPVQDIDWLPEWVILKKFT